MTPDRAQRILADHGIDASLGAAAEVAALARHALRIGATVPATGVPAAGRPAADRPAHLTTPATRPHAAPPPSPVRSDR